MQELSKLTLSAIILFGFIGILSAQDNQPSLSNSLTLRVGTEILNYQEVESTTETTSSAEVMSKVMSFNLAQEYESVLIGLKGVVPYAAPTDTEKWDQANIASYQTNDLAYSRLRVDGYLGYNFEQGVSSEAGTWYAGLRYSKAVQERSDFYVRNVYINAPKAKETIESYHVIAGYMGVIPVIQRNEEWGPGQKAILNWTYQFEYALPVYNKVDNTAMPDITYRDRQGYGVEVKTGLSYSIGSFLSFGFDLYGGRTYWQGSDWKVISATEQYKWPENKTDYIGGEIGLTLTF
jgi:hypothetical protein